MSTLTPPSAGPEITSAADRPVPARVVAGVIFGGSLAVMDATVVVPALDTIADQFGAQGTVGWLVTAYLLASAVTIPLWGRALDVWGERAAYSAALAVFALGTLLAMISPNIAILVGARVLQGIGGGGLTPLGQAILAGRCSPQQRSRLQIWYTIYYAIFAAVGPFIGAAALSLGSWRMSFAVLLVALILPVLLLRGQLSTERQDRHRRFDLPGAALLTIALLGILVAVQLLGTGQVLPAALSATIGGVAATAFLRHARRAADPVLCPGLLGRRPIGVGVLIAVANGFALFGCITALPMVAAEAGAGPAFIGMVVVPLTAGWTVLSAVSAKLTLRVGLRVLILVAGPLTAAAGAVLVLAGTSPDLAVVQLGLLTGATMAGVAAGLVAIPNLMAAQSAAPRADLGATTALVMFARNLGGMLGVAIPAALAGALGGTVGTRPEVLAVFGLVGLGMFAAGLVGLRRSGCGEGPGGAAPA